MEQDQVSWEHKQAQIVKIRLFRNGRKYGIAITIPTDVSISNSDIEYWTRLFKEQVAEGLWQPLREMDVYPTVFYGTWQSKHIESKLKNNWS